MKRPYILITGILGALSLWLAGCGNTVQETPSGSTGDGLTAEYENALPVESQLILGTLLLEDTENAVTAEQAAELLSLWQLQKALSASDTAAAQEKEALIRQIQETMTKDQIQVIAAMQLTRQDLFAYMQKAGLAQMPRQSGTPAASGSGGGDFTGGMVGEPPAGFVIGGGDMPAGGGMPAGGMGPGAGGVPENLTAEQIATMEARRASGGGMPGSSSALLDALIDLLEERQAG